MLHYWLWFFALWSPGQSTECDLSRYPSVDYATEAHRSALKTCLAQTMISFRAERPNSPNLTVPGATDLEVRGIRIRESAVLTVAAASGLKVFEKTGGQPVKLLRVEHKLGLAELTLRSESKLADFKPKLMQAGRVFFCIDANGQLHRVSISKRGDGGLGYYWHLPVLLPLGTPLFDATGQAVSLVALQVQAESYALPAEAFEDFLRTATSKE